MATRDHADLVKQRSQLLRELADIDDLRRGSLRAQYRKCGKPNCHCAGAGAQGHGPYWLLTWLDRDTGKSRGRTIRADTIEQTRAQIGEYQRLRGLVRELVEVSGRICDARLDRNSIDRITRRCWWWTRSTCAQPALCHRHAEHAGLDDAQHRPLRRTGLRAWSDGAVRPCHRPPFERRAANGGAKVDHGSSGTHIAHVGGTEIGPGGGGARRCQGGVHADLLGAGHQARGSGLDEADAVDALRCRCSIA